MDRSRYEPWHDAGARTMGDRIRERVTEVLATHRVAPLPKKVDAGIDKIIAAADKRASASQTSLV